MTSENLSTEELGLAIKQVGLNSFEVKQHKRLVQQHYQAAGSIIYNNIFLNWGLWDSKLHEEYLPLSTASTVQIYSQLLLYYLIRPLIRSAFFNKRVLDIGCGNGIGIKKSAELLQAQFALGVDLTPKLIANANHHFHDKKIQFMQADAEHLPLENESFDIITNLESSHLYPEIELFFAEVERVLSSGGFFCYADVYIPTKQQTNKLEAFIKNSKHLKIVKKHDITKMVQASIYQRVILQEDIFCRNACLILGCDEEHLYTKIHEQTAKMGLEFLPWWWIRFKNPAMKQVAKNARKNKYWDKKYYFYYLIQKI